MSAPEDGERRFRIDVNLTAVTVTALLVLGAVALAWIGTAFVEAKQGLDVRPMLTVRVGPQLWTDVGAAIAASPVVYKVLRRTNRTEQYTGKALPEAQAATHAEVVEVRTEQQDLRASLKDVQDSLDVLLQILVRTPDPAGLMRARGAHRGETSTLPAVGDPAPATGATPVRDGPSWEQILHPPR